MKRIVELNKEHHSLVITQDNDAESPDTWGNEDIFLVYDHRQFTVERQGYKPSSIHNYSLLCASEETFDSRDDDFDKYWIFPVYAHIHSGVSLSLGNSGYPFDCKFDTSMTGFILVEKEQGVLSIGSKPTFVTEPEAKNYAEGLIDTWNQYLSGEVYQFVVIEKKMCSHCGHIEEVNKDSMCGFYGELNSELIDDMLGHTEYEKATILVADTPPQT